MIVRENHGDILYTFEFERCKNRHGFTVWLCRKVDPESKGLVESGVKFIKYNFARHRTFVNLMLWSQDCQDWLVRTGNGKIHAETKKIPAEAFALEKAHLKPVISFAKDEPRTDRIPTPVRKNNTIRFNASRYSVPMGTYTLCQSVSVQEAEGHLEIYDTAGLMIARHPLAATAGEQIVNTSHRRDASAKVRELFSEAMSALGDTPLAEMFLLRIQKARKRYFRDQLQLILTAVRKYDPGVIRTAVLACAECESSPRYLLTRLHRYFRNVVLVTNLPMDFGCEELRELYSKRGGCETNFDRLKNKQLLEIFTGETETAVLQDFYAEV